MSQTITTTQDFLRGVGIIFVVVVISPIAIGMLSRIVVRRIVLASFLGPILTLVWIAMRRHTLGMEISIQITQMQLDEAVVAALVVAFTLVGVRATDAFYRGVQDARGKEGTTRRSSEAEPSA